jgi:hypothetical protein
MVNGIKWRLQIDFISETMVHDYERRPPEWRKSPELEAMIGGHMPTLQPFGRRS